MNETKFTPGPWCVGTPPPNGQQTIGTEMGLMVAVATTGVGMAEETKANAHLIAAAPDLYEALEELMYARTDKAERMAEAALRKAKGVA